MQPEEPVDAETVGALGEFGLISRVIAGLPDGDLLLGPGDDAALVAAPDGRVVATTDMLVEGRHFRLDWSSGYDVGRKAAAQNLADVAAMGARPTALLVSLGCPPSTPIPLADDLVRGLADECGLAGAAVAGGDVVRSERLVLGVTALGDLDGRAPVTRSGARPGDLVAVAGRLGLAAAGLAVLQRGFRSPRAVVEAHRRPEPPYAEGPRAADLGATAMCDVSDGLLGDCGHIATASAVCIDLDPDRLPVADVLREVGAALTVNPLDWVLGGGEDHPLVAAFPSGTALPETWTVVGEVRACVGEPSVTVGGRAASLPGGFDHFRGAVS